MPYIIKGQGNVLPSYRREVLKEELIHKLISFVPCFDDKIQIRCVPERYTDGFLHPIILNGL